MAMMNGRAMIEAMKTALMALHMASANMSRREFDAYERMFKEYALTDMKEAEILQSIMKMLKDGVNNKPPATI